MSSNLIIFIIFATILVISISEALSIFIIKEKGRNTWLGILLGILPIIGQIIGSFLKTTDTQIVEEMYDRNLISKNKYEETKDIVLKK